jgi:hypothetical protein
LLRKNSFLTCLLKVVQVKLVPGVELVVAPKKRQVNRAPATGSDVENDQPQQQEKNSIGGREAWLRVQEIHSSFVKMLDVPGIKCSTTPSTVVFISSNTAKVGQFEDGQLVVMNSGQDQMQPQIGGSNGTVHRRGASLKRHRGQREGVAYVEDESVELDEETQHRDVTVRIKVWEGVAPGHVMVALPLRIFIGARIHMRMYL